MFLHNQSTQMVVYWSMRLTALKQWSGRNKRMKFRKNLMWKIISAIHMVLQVLIVNRSFLNSRSQHRKLSTSGLYLYIIRKQRMRRLINTLYLLVISYQLMNYAKRYFHMVAMLRWSPQFRYARILQRKLRK